MMIMIVIIGMMMIIIMILIIFYNDINDKENNDISTNIKIIMSKTRQNDKTSVFCRND